MCVHYETGCTSAKHFASQRQNVHGLSAANDHHREGKTADQASRSGCVRGYELTAVSRTSQAAPSAGAGQ